MRWTKKARVQNAVALMPESISHPVYYWLQRHFGALRRPNPMKGFAAGFEFARKIGEAGRSVNGATFLEIGTGRRLNIPISLWLLGAEKIITADLHSYLKAELVREDLNFLRLNIRQVESFVASNHGSREKLRELLTPDLFNEGNKDGLRRVLDLCHVMYMPRHDGGNLPLKDGSIDFHLSNQVFEHVPSKDLLSILREGARLLREDGLLIHRIDHTDHFAHSDRSLSAINFLRFSDDEWMRLAGNRFMYMNRLRVDDYEQLFAQAMLNIRFTIKILDPEAAQLIESGRLCVAEQFKSKSLESLATTESWIVASKASGSG